MCAAQEDQLEIESENANSGTYTAVGAGLAFFLFMRHPFNPDSIDACIDSDSDWTQIRTQIRTQNLIQIRTLCHFRAKRRLWHKIVPQEAIYSILAQLRNRIAKKVDERV